MVAGEDDECVALESKPAQPLEQLSEPRVGHRYLGGVQHAQALQHQLGLLAGHPVFDPPVARHCGLGPAVAAIAQGVGVATWRGPGLVRLVGVDDQREGLVRVGHLESLDAGPEDLRGERSALVLGVIGVGYVAPDALGHVRFTHRGMQPVIQRVRRHGHIASSDLATVASEEVEAASERLVRGREPEEGVIGHVGSPPPGPPENAWKRAVHILQRRPTRLGYQALLVLPIAEGEHAPPGEDRIAGRHGGHRLREGAGEAHAASSECVEVRSRRARPVGVVHPQAVHDDHKDVGRLPRAVGARSAGARVRRPGGGRPGGHELSSSVSHCRHCLLSPVVPMRPPAAAARV